MRQPIQLYRGTAANFADQNPLLLKGELALVYDDSGKVVQMRAGDGARRWNLLPAISMGDGVALQEGALTSAPDVAPNAAAVLTALSQAVAGLVAVSSLKTVNNQPLTGGGNLTLDGVADPQTVRLAFPAAVNGVVSIDLTRPANGTAYPLVLGNLVSVTADLSLVVAANPALLGLGVIDFVTTGAGSVTIGGSAPNVLGATIDGTEVGRKYTVRARNEASGVYWIIQKGDLISGGGGSSGDGDTIAPVFQTPHVENSNKRKILFPYVETGTLVLLGSVVLGGTDAGSFAIVSQTIVGSNVEVVLNADMNSTTQLTLAAPGGYARDSATPTPNLSVAKAATAVVNNILVGAPNAPTLSSGGSATQTAQPLALTAGAVDSLHGAASSYAFEKSTDGGTTWTSVAGSGLTTTATGLTANTAYKYRGKASNAGGDSAYSAVLTLSTAAPVAGGSLTVGAPVASTAAFDLTALGYKDYLVGYSNAAASGGQLIIWGRKNIQTPRIGDPYVINATDAQQSPPANTLSWSDGTTDHVDVANNGGKGRLLRTDALNAGGGGAGFVLSGVGLTPEKLRLFFECDSNNTGQATTALLKAVLSDNSSPPAVATVITGAVQGNGYEVWTGYVDFTFNAASPGQSVTFTGLSEDNSHQNGAQFSFIGAALMDAA